MSIAPRSDNLKVEGFEFLTSTFVIDSSFSEELHDVNAIDNITFRAAFK